MTQPYPKGKSPRSERSRGFGVVNQPNYMKTFELLQTRKDGTLSSVTFVKAANIDEAKLITDPAMCTGVKVLREVKAQ